VISGRRNRFLMEIADSHAHLDMAEFDPDREEVVRRAWAGGVKVLLCPIDLTAPESLPRILKLKQEFSWVSAAAGIHPHQAKDFSPSHLETIRRLARAGKIAAVGEIGIDHHYNYSPAPVQAEVFRAQLRLAQELELPVVVHSRDAGKQILETVEKEGFSRGGVLHCFTEDQETAERMIGLGFFISFSGILTYPNAQNLREIAAGLPLEKILVETDSPYLMPQPLRGIKKRNEPLFVIETAKILAELKTITLEELAAITLRNYRSAFRV
jgi:TatD DNase family protein